MHTHQRDQDIGPASDGRVEPGTPLVVLEAMKMRYELCAGVVASLPVAVGAQVKTREVLVEITVGN